MRMGTHTKNLMAWTPNIRDTIEWLRKFCRQEVVSENDVRILTAPSVPFQNSWSDPISPTYYPFLLCHIGTHTPCYLITRLTHHCIHCLGHSIPIFFLLLILLIFSYQLFQLHSNNLEEYQMSAYFVALDTIRKVLNNLKIRILIIVQPKLISVKKIDTHVDTQPR